MKILYPTSHRMPLTLLSKSFQILYNFCTKISYSEHIASSFHSHHCSPIQLGHIQIPIIVLKCFLAGSSFLKDVQPRTTHSNLLVMFLKPLSKSAGSLRGQASVHRIFLLLLLPLCIIQLISLSHVCLGNQSLIYRLVYSRQVF